MSRDVFALGVGGVEKKSFICQPLYVEVPLYNVQSPQSLKIDLERLNGDAIREGLTASLKQNGSAISVVIESNEIVNEPYYNLALTLNDEGTEFRKQFTVLLDLDVGENQKTTQPALVSSSQALDKSREASPRNRIMGPYDWAQRGAIPEKFGAVLEGQSLWRVARRISPAMGVTNNQMMWALYQGNPNAFSTGQIESLKAGSYLTIPSTQTVASVSDALAKQFLADLRVARADTALPTPSIKQVKSEKPEKADTTSDPRAAAAPTSTASTEPGDSETTAEQASSAAEDTSLTSFQLSGLDQAVNPSGDLVSVEYESQDIITSLSETILSMSEQLGEKNEQIAVLEARVADLENLVQGAELELTTDILTDRDIVAASPVALTSDTVAADALLTDSQVKTSWLESINNKITWLVLLFAVLLVVSVMLREKLAGIWSRLNLGRETKQIEFRSVVTEMAERSEVAEDFAIIKSSGMVESPEILDSSTADYDAVERVLLEPKHEAVRSSAPESFKHNDGQRNLSRSEPGIEAFRESGSELSSEPVSDGFSNDATSADQQGFERRIARAISDNDLAFASQFLEDSKGHDVDIERYHYYRLKLLALQHDEDAFYDHYESIEDDLPTFNRTTQTDISKLIVSLAQV